MYIYTVLENIDICDHVIEKSVWLKAITTLTVSYMDFYSNG